MFYDATFGRLVKRRVKSAISHMNIGDDDTVLDLGIGTGCSLNYYPNKGRIIGIDLSSGMLRECRKKIVERNLDHATVFQADAMRLPFADNTFDHIFISHVISVVSDPCRLVVEAQRVAKPGARIIILNHFQSANRLIALVEKALSPICTKLGWRSDLALQELITRTKIEIDYRYQLRSIDLWETVVVTNNKSALSLPVFVRLKRFSLISYPARRGRAKRRPGCLRARSIRGAASLGPGVTTQHAAHDYLGDSSLP